MNSFSLFRYAVGLASQQLGYISPELYLAALRFKRKGHWSQKWIISEETEIVIEGFPRCGNSFAKSAFLAANPNVSVVGTHVHHPAQVLKAVELNIPTIVAIREPRAAVASLRGLSVEINRKVMKESGRWSREINVVPSIAAILIRYSRFYEALQHVKGSIVVAEFKQIVHDFGVPIAKLNERFDGRFGVFQHTDENVETIFSNNPFHLSPSKEREEIKKQVELALDSAPSHLISRAERAYRRFVE
jgi:hypothetical protein